MSVKPRPTTCAGSSTSVSCGNARVFGDVCVTCRKVKYVTDRAAKVRKPDKLVLCQTYEPERLLRPTAEKKSDDDLVLLLINDVDLIEKEVPSLLLKDVH